MIKAETQVVWPDEEAFFRQFNALADEAFEAMAQDCADFARSFVEVETGTLQKSIQARKSKFKDGGWICRATAPHAHLVEFGHVQVKDGQVIGQVPAHPFIRPAAEMVIKDIEQYLKKE